MEKYKLFIKRSALKELEDIPKIDLQRIIKQIQSLSENPWPVGNRKLSAKEYYRIRQGNYRIVYSILREELEIHIQKIGHRREIYRDL